MRFKVGQRVKVMPANAMATVIEHKHLIFGSFYVVEFDDGSTQMVGWNNLQGVSNE